MPTSIDTFKKVYIELDVSSSPQQYSLTNNTTYTNSGFLNFSLITNSQSQVVELSVIQKTSVSGTIENTQTFTLNNSNNLLNRNINLFTPYTLIDISYNSIANSILSGFIEKMTMGDTIIIDLSGQPILYQNEIDISGQRVDISGQRVDISGQRVDISGQRVDISGQRVDISGQRVDISGQRVDISGQRVDISGQRLDISGQRLDISGQIVDISGQSMYIMAVDVSYNTAFQIQQTTNQYGSSGLNVYQIYSKKIIYPLNGNSSGAVAGQFIGAGALAYAWTSINIGLNYPYTFNIYHGTTGTKYVDVEYIDANGDLATSNNIAITSTSTTANLTNAININSIYWSPTSSNANNTTSVIVKDSTLGVYRNNINTFNCGSSIITCPNGYIGIISDLYCYTSGGDDFIMIIKDKYNNIKHTRYMPGITPTNNKYYPVGNLNYPLYPGDSVFFAGALSAGGSRHVNATVTLTSI